MSAEKKALAVTILVLIASPPDVRRRVAERVAAAMATPFTRKAGEP